MGISSEGQRTVVFLSFPWRIIFRNIYQKIPKELILLVFVALLKGRFSGTYRAYLLHDDVSGTIVAFLTLAGLSSTAQAKLLDIQLSSKKGQVSAWKMNDGYTMMAIVRPAVDGLEDAIRKEMVPGMRFKVTPIHGGSQEVQISLADPILKHSASRKRMRLSFQVHYQTREENMILRIKSRFCAGSIIFRGSSFQRVRKPLAMRQTLRTPWQHSKIYPKSMRCGLGHNYG